MSITELQQEWIDKYLRDEMDGEALENFNNALKSNKIFKNEFVFQKSLRDAAELEAIRESISQAKIDNAIQNKNADPQFKMIQNSITEARSKNLKIEQRQSLISLVKRIAVAASILFVAFVGWNNFRTNEFDKDFEMIVNNIEYKDIKNKEIQKVSGSSDVIRNKIEKMEKAHKENRFDEAFKFIHELKSSQFKYYPVQLQYVEAVMHTQKAGYPKALEILNPIIQGNTIYKNESRWLRSLIYLKTNENIKAKDDLEILIDSKSYRDKAEQKLNKHF